ncbi:MAG: NAD-binding protein [Elusimicrobiota bacterium]
MKIIILGCGKIGRKLALILSQEENEITIIDRNSDSFRKLAKSFKGTTVLGSGVNREVLKRAGINRADYFIAVTEKDNTNIMTAEIAKDVFKVANILALVKDPVRAGAYQELDLNTLCPTEIIVKMIAASITEKKKGGLGD